MTPENKHLGGTEEERVNEKMKKKREMGGKGKIERREKRKRGKGEKGVKGIRGKRKKGEKGTKEKRKKMGRGAKVIRLQKLGRETLGWIRSKWREKERREVDR